MKEPAPLGDLVKRLLDQLGVADLTVWNDLQSQWEELSGEPWAGQSTPVSLQDGVLTVEAHSAPAVSLLRYGQISLVQRLESALGPGVVREVRVRPPARRSR